MELVKASVLLGALCLLGPWSCRPSADSSVKTYRVHSTDDEIEVDGRLDERAWADAALDTDFTFPWQEREAPATEFRGLTDDTHFYFAFRVEDADIVIDDGDDEQAVARGDRVELFFTSDPELGDYICFEIDPSGRVLDYRAAYYREFDRDWHLPELVVATVLTGTGYIVEGRIPHAGFRDAGLATLADDGKVLTGVFRAEYSHRDDGEPLAEWISWVTPSSAEPDFHIPSAFGWLQTR